MQQKIKKISVKITIFTLMAAMIGLHSPSYALAASLTSLSDNMSRLAENTDSNHDIRFVTPSGVGSGETITLTFSADFDLTGVDEGDIDFAEGNSNNCTTATFTDKTVAASPSGATWGAAIAGQVLTITSGTDTVTADRCVQIEIGTNATSGGAGTAQITNGALDDDDTITIAGTFGDTGTIQVDIIADDQVVISATVDPSITFSISDNTIGFGSLSASDDRFATGDGTGSSSATSAHDLVAGTNATSGYVLYMLGDTLTSGANTITAIGGANTASAPGTEQFGVRFGASGGSGAVSAPYAAAGYAFASTGATQDEIASSAGPSADTTYSATYVANIASQTEAGNYSTTLTYTATATY